MKKQANYKNQTSKNYSVVTMQLMHGMTKDDNKRETLCSEFAGIQRENKDGTMIKPCGTNMIGLKQESIVQKTYARYIKSNMR